MILRTLIAGMMVAMSTVSTFANVTPLVLGQRTGFLHDPLGRVVTLIRPDLATEHNAYDPLGNLVAYTNAKNVAIVQTTYDGQSRPIAQTNALGNGKSWTYDAAGNLISRRDAEGAETTISCGSVVLVA